MKLISHRGNIDGKKEEYENHPVYIDTALDSGYDVEIDIWMKEGILFLGHDRPDYGITQKWLNERRNKLWIHCKNIEAVEWFNIISGFNYFWHETDTVTLTSHGYIWAYPGKQPIKQSIAVLPELYKDDISECTGVCSDFIKKYENERNSILHNS